MNTPVLDGGLGKLGGAPQHLEVAVQNLVFDVIQDDLLPLLRFPLAVLRIRLDVRAYALDETKGGDEKRFESNETLPRAISGVHTRTHTHLATTT